MQESCNSSVFLQPDAYILVTYFQVGNAAKAYLRTRLTLFAKVSGIALRCVRNGTKLLYGFTIQSLSTSGHKGSFIGIMFVLHSCFVLTAFTTTSETVY